MLFILKRRKRFYCSDFFFSAVHVPVFGGTYGLAPGRRKPDTVEYLGIVGV